MARFGGKVFVDASYEGDLMAQAKVSYTYGRESAAQYGESLAGVRDRTPYHQFLIKKVWTNATTAVPVLIPAYGPGRTLLPEISARPKGATGEADRKVQAYNFRLCMTRSEANRVPFPKPRGYDPKQVERWRRIPLDAPVTIASGLLVSVMASLPCVASIRL